MFRYQSMWEADHILQACPWVTEMPERPQRTSWSRIYRSQAGSQYRNAPQHCRTTRWSCMSEPISSCFRSHHNIELDLPAAEPSFAGYTAPVSARPIVRFPASSNSSRKSVVSSAAMGVIVEHIRNCCSKCHERKEGNLVQVSKAHRWRSSQSHNPPKENASRKRFGVYLVCKDRCV